MSYYTLFLTLLEVFLLIWSLFTKSGRDSWGWFFNHIVGGAVGQVKPLLDELAPTVAQLAGQLRDALNSHGGGHRFHYRRRFSVASNTSARRLKSAAPVGARRRSLGEEGVTRSDNSPITSAAAEAFAVAFGAGLTARA